MTVTWTPTHASTEASWTHDYVSDLLSRPCIPAPEHKIGSTTVKWKEIDPGVVLVHSSGGSFDDRYIAEQIVVTRLMAHGYERAEFTLDPEHKTSAWSDIMAKARRLINSGHVQMLRNGPNNVASHVIGDHGEYDCEIGRDDPNSRVITTWKCDCKWDDFAWQRTRQWKKYEGRVCAHVLATFWLGQATPLDEELAAGQAPTPGQRGFQPQTPADIGSYQPKLPLPQEGPEVMPAAPADLGQPTAPGMAQPTAQPTAPNILPPFPGEQMQLFPPGQLPVGQPPPPGSSVSEPGARQPTPFNPLQNPSTYSKVANEWRFEAAAEFNNSDMVRLEEEEYGILEGKSKAHGAGQYKLIPKGSIGEVLGQDPTFGWVDVIFSGPQKDAGPLEPYHVRALIEPTMLTPMPNVRKPGPAIRRR